MIHDDDPYRAPEAPLEIIPDAGAAPVSEKALQLLTGSRWGMRVIAIALMGNSLLTLGLLALSLPGTGRRTIAMAVIAVIMTLILFLPGLRLMQGARAITRAAVSREEKDILHALERHQQFWKIMGLVMIVVAALLYFLFAFLLR